MYSIRESQACETSKSQKVNPKCSQYRPYVCSVHCKRSLSSRCFPDLRPEAQSLPEPT